MRKPNYLRSIKRIGLNLFLLNFLVVFLFLISLMGLRVAENYDWLYNQVFKETQLSWGNNMSKRVLGENFDTQGKDPRVLVLEEFFNKYNSPLLPYAQKFVDVSDQYGYHYGLLPAIAMVESGLCRVIPDNSYNCWGWGIYGKTVTRFASYDEAIDTVALGIKRDYFDRGYTTPEKIMSKYNPTNHNNWLGGVNFFLEKLN